MGTGGFEPATSRVSERVLVDIRNGQGNEPGKGPLRRAHRLLLNRRTETPAPRQGCGAGAFNGGASRPEDRQAAQVAWGSEVRRGGSIYPGGPMNRVRLRKPSPSMAAALLALFVALGGT